MKKTVIALLMLISSTFVIGQEHIDYQNLWKNDSLFINHKPYKGSNHEISWPKGAIYYMLRIGSNVLDSVEITGDTIKVVQQINDIAFKQPLVNGCDTIYYSISHFYSFVFLSNEYGYKIETDCTFKKVVKLHLWGDKRKALVELIKLVL